MSLYDQYLQDSEKEDKKSLYQEYLDSSQKPSQTAAQENKKNIVQKAGDFISNLFKKNEQTEPVKIDLPNKTENKNVPIELLKEETTQETGSSVKTAPMVKSVIEMYNDFSNGSLTKALEDKYNRFKEEEKKPTPDTKKLNKLQEEMVEINRALDLPSAEFGSVGEKYKVSSKYKFSRDAGSFFSGATYTVTGLVDSITKQTEEEAQRYKTQLEQTTDPKEKQFLESHIKTIGYDKEPKTREISQKMKRWAEEISPTNPDFGDMLKSGLGSMGLFLVTAYLSKGKAAPPAFVEAMGEAGTTYETKREQGKSIEESSKSFDKSLVENLILAYATDKFGILSDQQRGVKKALMSASGEAVQESAQQMISNIETDQELMTGVLESGAVGGVLGGGASAINFGNTAEVTGEISPTTQANDPQPSANANVTEEEKQKETTVTSPVTNQEVSLTEQTSQRYNELKTKSEATPITQEQTDAGIKRFYQAITKDGQTTWYFDNLESLAEYMKSNTGDEIFQFVDIPQADMRVQNEKEGVYVYEPQKGGTQPATAVKTIEEVKPKEQIMLSEKESLTEQKKALSETLKVQYEQEKKLGVIPFSPGSESAITEDKLTVIKEKLAKIEQSTAPKTKVQKAKTVARDKAELVSAVKELYKQNLASRVSNNVTNQPIWAEQMQENIDNPERYHAIDQATNPKGIEIGDSVLIKDAKFGDRQGIVTSIMATPNSRAYKGGFAVHTISPESYGGWTQIDDVEVVKKTEVKAKPENKPTEPTKKKVEPSKPRKRSARGSSLGNASLGNGAASTEFSELLKRIKATEGDTQTDFAKDFKSISEGVTALANKYGAKIAEKHLSRRLLGVFKHSTGNVRVQALNNVSTAVHEIAHKIDDTNKIGFDIIAGSVKETEGEGGKLTRRGDALIKELTDVYVQYYGGGNVGKKTHALNKRITEGYATFMENSFARGEDFIDQYPVLKEEILTEGGKYYNEQANSMIDDATDLLEKFAGLTPEERIASVIVSDERINTKETGFNLRQRLYYEMRNKYEPIIRFSDIAKETGDIAAQNDPAQFVYHVETTAGLLEEMISGDNIYMLNPVTGNYGKLENVKTLAQIHKLAGDEMIGDTSVFSMYSTARQQAGFLKQYAEASQQYTALMDQIAETQELAKDGDMSAKQELKELLPKAQKLEQTVKDLQGSIEKNPIVMEDAQAVVEKYKGTNIEEAFNELKKFRDNVIIEFALRSGKISAKQAEEYKSGDDYSPMRRLIQDPVTVKMSGKGGAKGKPVFTKSRRGSSLDIIDPLKSTVTDTIDVFQSGMQNLLWQKMEVLASKSRLVAERFEEIETIRVPDPEVQGKFTYPQLADKSLIPIYEDGKPHFRLASPEVKVVNEVLNAKGYSVFAKVLMIAPRIFTRLTTSGNPLWTATNITKDQFIVAYQTDFGTKPFIDPIKYLVTEFYDPKNIGKLKGLTAMDLAHVGHVMELLETEEFKKFRKIGGDFSTLSAYNKMSARELLVKIQGKRTVVDNVLDIVEAPLNLLEVPGQLSQLSTLYAEYRNGKNKGLSDVEALNRARMLQPFMISGNYFGAGEYVKSVAYLNAGIQMLGQFIEEAPQHPRRYLVLTTALTVLASALTALIADQGSDDQKEIIKNLDGSLLARYIIFPHPFDDKKLMRIPIPEQVGSVIAPIELMILSSYFGNGAKFPEYLDAATSFLPGQLNPLKPVESLINLFPTAVKPTLEATFNTKTYPSARPIVSESMKRLPPEMQYDERTSEIAKWIGKTFGASPKMLDFWVKEQFGTLPSAVVNPKNVTNPFEFVKYDYISGRVANNFYDERSKVYADYNFITKTRKEQDGVQKLKDNGYDQKRVTETLRLYHQYSGLSSKLNDYTKVRNNLTPERKATMDSKFLKDMEQLGK